MLPFFHEIIFLVLTHLHLWNKDRIVEDKIFDIEQFMMKDHNVSYVVFRTIIFCQSLCRVRAWFQRIFEYQIKIVDNITNQYYN